jgi:hypothetical protein
MRLIAILIAIFGGSLIWYGGGGFEDVQLPHSIGIQYMTLGGAFLFGGLFLYAYIGKRKK